MTWMGLMLRRVGHFLGSPRRAIRDRLRAREDVRLVEGAGLVDDDWYRRTYPDVASAGMTPSEHYVRYGFREGRDPNPTFSTREYLRLGTGEIAVHAAVHYLLHRAGASRPAPAPPTRPARASVTPTSSPGFRYEHFGRCPICEKSVRFRATDPWYREHLFCDGCRDSSTPRERALMHTIRVFFPEWRSLSIHESSPIERGASAMLRQHCRSYTATQLYPGMVTGTTRDGIRCEDLEKLTFSDECFDLTVSQDVMEHVNRPDLAHREIARTLRPGGAHVFTAPTYKGLVTSFRRAFVGPDGVEHLHEPEYHGNPVDPRGALVTFHYGYDLPERIHEWSGLHTTVLRFHDHHIGAIGDFTEVYVSRKV